MGREQLLKHQPTFQGMEGRPVAGLYTKRVQRPPLFPSTNCINSAVICNSSIALRGIYMDNLHAALDAPTALNVTVQATRRREVRRSSRPREYLTEQEFETKPCAKSRVHC